MSSLDLLFSYLCIQVTCLLYTVHYHPSWTVAVKLVPLYVSGLW